MAAKMTTNSDSLFISNIDNCVLDYTEIDQGLNLWSEILPLIEKQIVTLTTVAQEMQECPERQKYVDALMKIAVRVNDVEEKATTCIKEARTQLKKTKLIDKTNDIQENEKVRHRKVRNNRDDENSDEDDESDNEMEIDESQINEQIEVSALNSENLEKLQNHLQKILLKQPNSNESNIDADNRYADFLECISKMQGNDEDDDNDNDTNIIDQVASNKCPLTQKPFVQPVQNKKCKHKYEKMTVLKYIADKNKAKRPAKCPSSGCNNILNEKDLINV
ncbi:unnamed protein product [Rotaria sp. Silwood1]|nr:unnamed protein product [Rotaria sp. Silwood1]CAF3419196.1 unnamed protein product [Rotaria sp. Silwood1]CAF3444378.1 unnamed protein product [Rotaria sp. Silwood1]CAF4566222.1 unnamed protein product [Rotaria sp. Silwood1]CAF4639855.1 unnamed protein product [Rotaria sp. Silwood1]